MSGKSQPAVSERSQPALEAKYGLPPEVKFCKRCVISNQRPNSTVEYKHTRDSKKATIAFDAEGVCDACRVAEAKKQIDWKKRDGLLRELCDRHRRNDGRCDCLVPGSGGKDSFYTAHLLKYEYGMHPLTVTWAPHIYTDWGWKNFQSWLGSGFDNLLITPNPRVHRLLTRLAVERIFHPFQPFFFGQKAVAPRIAAKHEIKLIMYGESNAEYGDPKSMDKTPRQAEGYYTAEGAQELYLAATSLKELEADYGLEKADFFPYLPADPAQVAAAGVEVHFFSYYKKWHPQSCYYYAAEHGGFQASPERTPGTYNKYASIDDKIDDFHFYTTYIKFGIGRTTTDAAQEIRSGDITREEGVALVKRYDGEFPERFAEELLRYLSVPKEEFPVAHKRFEQPVMTRESFFGLCDRFRSEHLWQRTGSEWKLRHAVWHPAHREAVA